MRLTLIIILSASLVLFGCNPGPRNKPTIADLVGTYRLTKESEKFLLEDKAYRSIPKSEIYLHIDGTASIAGLPDCYVNGFGASNGQFLSGQGRWEIETNDNNYGITLIIIEGGTLKPGLYHGSSILIKSRTPPFKLQFGIGDPDQDEFINFNKTIS